MTWIQHRLTYEGVPRLNLGRHRNDVHWLQQIGKTVFTRISVSSVVMCHNVKHKKRECCSFFPWGQRIIQGCFLASFFLFMQTLAFPLSHTSCGPLHTPICPPLLWRGEPAFFSGRRECLVSKWCSVPGHGPASLRTPSSVWIGQGAGLHGWLNTEEHSGPPVSQRERLTHNEALLHLYELHHHSDCVLE